MLIVTCIKYKLTPVYLTVTIVIKLNCYATKIIE